MRWTCGTKRRKERNKLKFVKKGDMRGVRSEKSRRA
jgi:hypothetical protein